MFFLVLIVFWVLVSDKVRANTCSGSGSRTVTDEWCIYNSWSRTYSCASKTFTDSNTCVIDSSNYCGWNTIPECKCSLSSDSKSCSEECRPASNTFLYNGCTTCVSVNGADGKCTDSVTNTSWCSWDSMPSKVCDSGSYGLVSETSAGIVWTCSGSSGKCGGSTGKTVTCSAVKKPVVNGADGKCNTTATSGSYCGWSALPTTKCDKGSPVYISDDVTGIRWSCSGTNEGAQCGGSIGSLVGCWAAKKPVVNGQCGSQSDGCFPPTTNLCLASYGNSAVSTNTNTFSWNCSGDCGGQTASCTSTRLIINGQCGVAKGGNFTSTPTTNLCAVGMASAVSLSGTTYSWSCNRNCNGSIDYCSAVYDTVPTLSSIVLKNISGTVIPPEAGLRNHGCDATFVGKTSLWTVTATDANGLNDIKTIDLRFVRQGDGRIYDVESSSPVNGVVTFTVDTTSYLPGTYDVQYWLEDQHTPSPGNTGWLNTGRDFYIWDCQVAVDGTIYDNSEALPCSNGNNQGFDQPIRSDISPFNFGYKDMVGGVLRRMTVSSPKFISPETLTWQNTYFLDNSSNFLGVYTGSKINNVCVNPMTYLLPRTYVDPYSASPSIRIEYNAIMDQEAWFRVRDGSVLAKVEAKNYVPVTCVADCETAVGGLVWSKKVNLSGNDTGSISQTQPQPPTREYYSLLKSEFNIGKKMGTVLTNSSSTFVWPDDVGTTRGVIFVEGDLNINQNMNLTGNDYVFLVVKGDITIAPSVTGVNGMFYSDGVIQASGENATQLKISGSLYGRNGVVLNRSYVNKRDNNLNPAIEVTYDPNLIFKLPKGFWETYNNWSIE